MSEKISIPFRERIRFALGDLVPRLKGHKLETAAAAATLAAMAPSIVQAASESSTSQIQTQQGENGEIVVTLPDGQGDVEVAGVTVDPTLNPDFVAQVQPDANTEVKPAAVEVYGSLEQGLMIINESLDDPDQKYIKRIVPRNPEVEKKFFDYIKQMIALHPDKAKPLLLHIVDINDPHFASNPERGWLLAGDMSWGIKFDNSRGFGVVKDGKNIEEVWMAFSDDAFEPENLRRVAAVVPNQVRHQLLAGISTTLLSGLGGLGWPPPADMKQLIDDMPFDAQWTPISDPLRPPSSLSSYIG